MIPRREAVASLPPCQGSASYSGSARTTGLIGLLVSLLLMSCGDRGPEAPAEKAPVTPQVSSPHSRPVPAPPALRSRLKTDVARPRVVAEVVVAPGEVALDLKRVAKINARIEGQAEQVYVQLGDRVVAGQRLAAIGSLQLDELIQEYLVAKAQADVAASSFQRTEKLKAEDIVTERRYVEERGRHLETKARYQHIREKLLTMGLTTTELSELETGRHDESHRYTLKAPLSGTVIAQKIVRGQGVAPGMELFEVVDTSRVWVFANLPIEQARRFQEGDIGTIIPKGGEPVTAPLTYLAPVAEETTRTVRVRFAVANPRGLLKPREYVDVKLTLPGSSVLAVPASALTMVDKVRGVFIQRDTGYVFAPVDVGREGNGWIEVWNGVAEGDQVVIEGAFDLKTILLKEHLESGEGR